VAFSSSRREGLVWEDIDWIDNGECLDLIEKVMGNWRMNARSPQGVQLGGFMFMGTK
jgi:hypothetical protein